MSRKETREKYSMKEFSESMKGIKGNISSKTLDELPMAYKNIDKVMEDQKDLVKILYRLTPLMVAKG